LVVRRWILADPERCRAANDLARAFGRWRRAEDPEPPEVANLLRVLGEEPLPTPAGRYEQAETIMHIGRVPDALAMAYLRAARDLMIESGTDDLEDARSLAREANRRVNNPTTTPRQVASGGLPTLGSNR